MMSAFDRYILVFGSFIIRHWLTIVNVLLFLFIVPILLYPYFMSTGDPTLVYIAGAIKAGYHPTCHQLPERSLFIFGYQMAVCSRCFAIYVSFLAGGLLFYFIKDKLKPFHIFYYVLICIPMAIDGFAQLFGVPIPRGIGPGFQLVWTVLSNNELRVLTGAIFGFGSALFVMPYMQQVLELEEASEKEQKKAEASQKPKAQ
jgi:uncharacterized membrane protein